MSCSSSGQKLDLADDRIATPKSRCGTQSYINRYASYVCSNLELEKSNDYLKTNTPIHNIKSVVINRQQKLLVTDEKIFGASLRERDQEIVCTRRLKVILNPGVGRSVNFQTGWMTYSPNCFQFKRR